MAYKLPDLAKWDLIEVTWHDAQSDHQMFDSNTLKANNCFRITVGRFIKIDGEEFIMASTDDRLTDNAKQNDGDCADVLWLPIGMVKKITKLSRPPVKPPINKKKPPALS